MELSTCRYEMKLLGNAFPHRVPLQDRVRWDGARTSPSHDWATHRLCQRYFALGNIAAGGPLDTSAHLHPGQLPVCPCSLLSLLEFFAL
jgi:hypothetical protein